MTVIWASADRAKASATNPIAALREAWFFIPSRYAPLGYIRRMSLGRVILSVLLPPLAVYDRGCGSILIVALLTCCGWVPGVIGALVILNKND